MSTIEELKQKGNDALQKKDFQSAVKFYTEGIQLDASNHIFYSNRSAAYLALNDFNKALEDAEQCLTLNPDFTRGYLRKGQALFGLSRLEECSSVVSKGLEKEPNNAQMIKLFKEAEEEMKKKDEQLFGQGGIANIFSSPDLWSKIKSNPKTSGFANQQDYVAIINHLAKNPGSIQQYLQDKRILTTFGVLLGADIQMPGDAMDEEIVMEEKKTEVKQEVKEEKKEEKKEEENVKLAAAEKELGNNFYMKKEFAEAMKHYDKAVELDPKNIIYRLNRAAVFLETKEYEKCIKECEEAIVVGRSVYTSFENIGKALCRMGTAYQKMEMYPEAIRAYKDSLIEHRSRDALTKLEDLERYLKKKEEEAYLSEEKSAEAKKLGNQCFQDRKYIESLTHYGEALKRNPKDHTIYHNRAASYMKMAEFGMAKNDLTKCLDADPAYVKAWDKLGQCFYHMKDYQKAIDSFKKGLDVDPNHHGCIEGIKLVQTAIYTNETDEMRAKRAMQDPEIQQILQDPIMQTVLRDLSDPKLSQKHLQNPEVAQKINKLIVAGVLGNKKKE